MVGKWVSETHKITRANRQFYALGRFIQEFELMVDSVRQVLIGMVQPDVGPDMRLLVILSSNSLTAQPLLEALRGVIGEAIRYRKFTDKRDKRLYKIMSQIQKEYSELVSLRNIIVHGTWHIGKKGYDELTVYKFKGVLDGGLLVAEAPKSEREIIALAIRCRKIARMIFGLGMTVVNNEFNPDQQYIEVDGRWHRRDNV